MIEKFRYDNNNNYNNNKKQVRTYLHILRNTPEDDPSDFVQLQTTYIGAPSALYVGSSCYGAAPFSFAAAPPNLFSASHCPPIFSIALFFLFLDF